MIDESPALFITIRPPCRFAALLMNEKLYWVKILHCVQYDIVQCHTERSEVSFFRAESGLKAPWMACSVSS